MERTDDDEAPPAQMIGCAPAEALPVGLLVAAYGKGIFPMVHEDGDIHWHDPDPRAVFDLDAIEADERTSRVIRSGRYRTTLNVDFEGVIRNCARREETWIDQRIISSFIEMHRCGLAISVEAWVGEDLVGGIYGVRMGGAFFGESMFGRDNAGKVAFHAMAEHLRSTGCALFDTQYINEFTQRLGAMEITRTEFKRRLSMALDSPASQ